MNKKNFTLTKKEKKPTSLVEVEGSDFKKHGAWYAVYSCTCGGTKEVRKSNVRHGNVSSCGCIGRLRAAKHLMTKTSEYHSWSNMKARCDKKGSVNYKRYGGRGITYQESWAKFENFISDMGLKPHERYSLDRIDNDGNYTKENCRWASFQTQANNTSTNVRVEYKGESLTLSELSRTTGIPASRISHRNIRGLDILKPVNKRRDLLIDGKLITQKEASIKYGIDVTLITLRLKRGWSDKDAVTRPIQKKRKFINCETVRHE